MADGKINGRLKKVILCNLPLILVIPGSVLFFYSNKSLILEIITYAN